MLQKYDNFVIHERKAYESDATNRTGHYIASVRSNAHMAIAAVFMAGAKFYARSLSGQIMRVSAAVIGAYRAMNIGPTM
jgi:hypothetical protein